MAKRKRQRLEDVLPKPPTKGGPLPEFKFDVEAAVRRGVMGEAFAPPPGPDDAVASFDRQVAEREHEVLDTAVIEEKRELSKLSFWFFTTQVLFHKIWQEHYHDTFHREICEEVQSLDRGEDFWAFLPREFKKSYLLNMAHNAWLIITDPDVRILLVGAREATVKPFAMLQKNMFVQGASGMEEFHRVFPDFVIQPGDKNLRQALQFMHPLRRAVLPDPTFRATYLGVSGAGWRTDVLKFDDPIERRSVSTPDQSRKALRNMLDMLPLVHTGSKHRNIIGMLTRWAYHDPGGFIIGDTGEAEKDEMLEKLRKHKRRVMIRHALEDPSTPCSRCPESVTRAYPHGEFDPENERAVPPDAPIHTREMILEKLEEYKLDPDLGESLWWHQYGNICLAPRDQKFQQHWFITAPFSYFDLCKRRAICVDAADKDFQEEGRGDWMVADFAEFDDYGRLLLVWCIASNEWTRATFQRNILAWCKATDWWPNVFGKEKVGNDSWLTSMGKLFLEYQRPVHMIPIPLAQAGQNIAKKHDRVVGALQAPYENAEIIFGKDYPTKWKAQTISEATNLGQIARDDFIDTKSLFMTEEIRPKHLFNRHAGPLREASPPPLCLYTAPGQYQPREASPQATPIEVAMESQRVRAGFTALPDVNSKSPEAQHEGLVLKLDF